MPRALGAASRHERLHLADELPGTARQSAFARQQFLADHDAVGGGLW
ncbi:hypothetical protein SLI_1217 [Streptomyces lividans 1326]|uniref:Uncharacterized protein n=1 Tax=Streptomyces lividans 1326 TaxID=1200984 RepID=A0A7U9DL24_STRLI|nr:hypothetical protein SLI_1217 [Streptomyces lividans 1326]